MTKNQQKTNNKDVQTNKSHMPQSAQSEKCAVSVMQWRNILEKKPSQLLLKCLLEAVNPKVSGHKKESQARYS